jgi:putative endonuclease
MKTYYVYIVSSFHRTVYVGVTNDLVRRIYEHKKGLVEGFSKKYKTANLVYYELFGSVLDAISREKEIKSWRREKKMKLIKSQNPKWEDMYLRI